MTIAIELDWWGNSVLNVVAQRNNLQPTSMQPGRIVQLVTYTNYGIGNTQYEILYDENV